MSLNLHGRNIPAPLHSHISEHSIVVRSPGRINLIGEHTDYNEGFVLPAAIDKAAYLVVTPRSDDQVHLHAIDLDETHDTTINDIHKTDRSWPAYLLGVVDQYLRKGFDVKGFDAALIADIPIGAGLSSSAAVECAMAMALNEWLQSSFDKLTMVKMAQKAEHDFAGVQCGIMDQFASMFGRKSHAVRLDCRSLEYEYLPINMEGTRIVLFDSGVKHALASTAYNTRRMECETGVALVGAHHKGVKNLRDVTKEMLDKYVLPEDELVYRRCSFIVGENERLLLGCDDLKKGDIAAFGKKMFITHEGLGKSYEVSCEELDFLVDQVKDEPAVYGARMMGGGFGGCTINLVKEESIDALVEKTSAAYYQHTKQELKTYIAQIEDGTSML